MSKWISIEDELPKNKENCKEEFYINSDAILAFSEGNIYVASYFSQMECFYDYYRMDQVSIKNVTHWMPLPNPPET